MPLLRRPHDHCRGLCARRRTAWSPVLWRRDQDLMRCLSLPARGSLRSLEHLVPGAAPVSSQCLQAPAGHHGPVLNQAVECGSSGQSAIISGCQLSVISGKAFPAKAAARPNPHSRPSAHRFPRVRSSEAFRRRPLYWVTRSRRAGIRNPSRGRPFSCAVSYLIRSSICRSRTGRLHRARLAIIIKMPSSHNKLPTTAIAGAVAKLSTQRG